MTNKLVDVLPQDADLIAEEMIRKHGSKVVKAEIDSRDFPFPSGNYRNVMVWWILEDDTAVGWNESPTIGFSFPYVGKKAIANFYKRYIAEKPKQLNVLETN